MKTERKVEERRPGPMAYNPEKISILNKAPRAIMPMAARLGSAPLGHGRNKFSAKNFHRINGGKQLHIDINGKLKKVPSAYAMYGESNRTPGPGEYYLPAAFGKQQTYNKSSSATEFQRV